MSPEDRAKTLTKKVRDECAGRLEWPGEFQIAALIREAEDEMREACARIAESHEAPYYVENPDEGFLMDLKAAILQAGFDYDREDGEEPETSIAKAVLHFLQTGQQSPRRVDSCASAAIRALHD